MKQKVLKTVLLLFFVKLIIIQLSWADWQTPTAIKVGQDGSQKCKIAKYKEYVYVLTAGGGDDKEKLFFYISTDRGGSFDEGRLLSSDENTSDIEIKAAPNGDIHLFWIGGYPRVLHYMKSTNNGAIFSPPLSINVEGDWADDFDCFVKDKDTLYFVFQGSAKPKIEIFHDIIYVSCTIIILILLKYF
ncbi:membrane protein [Candidatus Magnetomorum sp. HK-1]|nr:membrane protein [Candidatus Magnetomorum sp. HK-1]